MLGRDGGKVHELEVNVFIEHDAKHLPQTLKALGQVARLAECKLRGLVLGREVSRHNSVDAEANALYRSGPAASEVYFTLTGAGLLSYAMRVCFPTLTTDDYRSIGPSWTIAFLSPKRGSNQVLGEIAEGATGQVSQD